MGGKGSSMDRKKKKSKKSKEGNEEKKTGRSNALFLHALVNGKSRDVPSRPKSNS